MKSKNLIKVSMAGLLLTSPLLEASAFNISIDAGHGGNGSTPGKRFLDGERYEWDINDAVADYLKPMLEKYGVNVYRLDDETGQSDVSLNERLRRAINVGSDLHISIHQNSAGAENWCEATGTEVYYSTLGSARSIQLAKETANRMSEYIQTRNRGAKTNNLFITREFTNSNIDAILVEGLFMDNYEDTRYMMSDEYAQRYAQAIADSIYNTYRSQINNEPFQIQVRKDLGETLNIRKEPNATSEIVGEVNPGEVFTIVEVEGNFGKLASGAGWINISMKFTNNITLN